MDLPSSSAVLDALFSWKASFVYGYLAWARYVHFRGHERHKFHRQLTDHSTVIAPYNAFMYGFSAVPNEPFVDVGKFPELRPLQDNWRTIRDEALKLFDEGHIRAAATYNDLGFNSFFRRGWKRFYLKWYDAPVPSAVALCPKTVELVQSIPTLNGAMFAMLPAGGDLGRHRDPFAGSLRYHLGLATPNSDLCCIYVDGQPYAWRDGEAVMFDETYIHWAENRTGVDRVILFCAAIAIIGQESGFQADPAVPGLAKIARAELDKRRESAGIPKFALDAALALPSTSGKSYGDRLDAVKTEQQRTSSAASRSERRCSPIATRSGPGGLCR